MKEKYKSIFIIIMILILVINWGYFIIIEMSIIYFINGLFFAIVILYLFKNVQFT